MCIHMVCAHLRQGITKRISSLINSIEKFADFQYYIRNTQRNATISHKEQIHHSLSAFRSPSLSLYYFVSIDTYDAGGGDDGR